MFQQHLAIFHKRRPLPVWFLHPWLSATNGFYRNCQELGGGKMGGQKIILGGHLPPLAPPLALTILFQRCLLNKNISKCLQFYINCGWIGYIIDVPTRPFPIDYFNAKTDDCITVLTILFIVT